MMQTALANEWKAQVVPEVPENLKPDEIIWNLYALRGQESLHVVFMGNRQESATYVYGDHRTNPAHRAAVIKILTGRPDPRKLVKLEGHELIERVQDLKEVPWEHDAPAMDIMLAVLGKEITWVRKIDGGIQQGTVVREMTIEAGTLIFKIIDGKNYETQHFINGYRYRVEKVFRMGQNWWSATYLWENASDQTNWKELQHLFPTRKAALAACRAHKKSPRIN